MKYQYREPNSDDAIMHDINPLIVRLSQLNIHVDGTIHDSSNEYDPLPRSTFVSTDRHRKLNVEE